jgi:LAS superfamily LD-carboxypeptidase LdcB
MRGLFVILSLFISTASLASKYIEDAYLGGYSVPFIGEVVDSDRKGDFILMDDAAASYIELRKAAKAAGFNLILNSAYRSTADQHRMMRQRRRWAAQVGYSMHQSGRAVDIAGTRVRCRAKRRRLCKSALFAWLQENAPAYGWHNSAPKEPWHWLFSGTDTQTALKGYGRALWRGPPGQPNCSR